MFEDSGENRVQGVINLHNSVSLPRVKEGQKKTKGEMKGSPTSTSRREERGGRRKKINKADVSAACRPFVWQGTHSVLISELYLEDKS